MAWITTKDGRQVNTEWFDEDERKKYAQIEKAQEEAKKASEAESNIVKNKNGVEVTFDFKSSERHTEQRKALEELISEYNTRLEKVTLGSVKAAGDVDMMGVTMRLSSSHVSDAAHEFLHTLANTDADKYGLSNDKEFWSEIRKIRTAYRKAVVKDRSKIISSYADSGKLDEFAAEAFAQAISSSKGWDLHFTYGKDLTYSNMVLDVVNKYFRRRK